MLIHHLFILLFLIVVLLRIKGIRNTKLSFKKTFSILFKCPGSAIFLLEVLAIFAIYVDTTR
jgi:hypothetical protein